MILKPMVVGFPMPSKDHRTANIRRQNLVPTPSNIININNNDLRPPLSTFDSVLHSSPAILACRSKSLDLGQMPHSPPAPAMATHRKGAIWPCNSSFWRVSHSVRPNIPEDFSRLFVFGAGRSEHRIMRHGKGQRFLHEDRPPNRIMHERGRTYWPSR